MKLKYRKAMKKAEKARLKADPELAARIAANKIKRVEAEKAALENEADAFFMMKVNMQN